MPTWTERPLRGPAIRDPTETVLGGGIAGKDTDLVRVEEGHPSSIRKLREVVGVR